MTCEGLDYKWRLTFTFGHWSCSILLYRMLWIFIGLQHPMLHTGLCFGMPTLYYSYIILLYNNINVKCLLQHSESKVKCDAIGANSTCLPWMLNDHQLRVRLAWSQAYLLCQFIHFWHHNLLVPIKLASLYAFCVHDHWSLALLLDVRFTSVVPQSSVHHSNHFTLLAPIMITPSLLAPSTIFLSPHLPRTRPKRTQWQVPTTQLLHRTMTKMRDSTRQDNKRQGLRDTGVKRWQACIYYRPWCVPYRLLS
jgi:hypothetical protein